MRNLANLCQRGVMDDVSLTVKDQTINTNPNATDIPEEDYIPLSEEQTGRLRAFAKIINLTKEHYSFIYVSNGITAATDGCRLLATSSLNLLKKEGAIPVTRTLLLILTHGTNLSVASNEKCFAMKFTIDGENGLICVPISHVKQPKWKRLLDSTEVSMRSKGPVLTSWRKFYKTLQGKDGVISLRPGETSSLVAVHNLDGKLLGIVTWEFSWIPSSEENPCFTAKYLNTMLTLFPIAYIGYNMYRRPFMFAYENRDIGLLMPCLV